MEPVTFVVDKIKGFAKSNHGFIDGVIHRRSNSSRRNPIEILKRLQREAFSDLMKLRDRQDKVERVLTVYKTSKGSPFNEASTHVRGEVDSLGGVLMMSNIDQDAFGQAGINPGVNLRLTFETTVREKDSLAAEFVACQNGDVYGGGISGTALRLAKVSYVANVNDWFSAIAIPVGGQFRDLANAADSSNQRHGLTDLSFVGPPLLNQHNDAAIGLTVRKSNVTALMAQSISGVGRQLHPDRFPCCFNTFCQIVCQFPRGVKVSLMGLQHVSKSSSSRLSIGALAIPVGFLKRRETLETFAEGFSPPVEANMHDTASTGCIALKLESELDENTKIGGWIEMKNSNPKHLQWAVNAFDDSEDELGWGVNVSGMVEGPGNWGRIQAESYVKLNLGRNFSLKPGIAYTVDSDSRALALMLRSSWSL